MMDRIKYIESRQMKKDIPAIKAGDTVRVFSKIKEEGKTRLQAFEGIILRLKGAGLRKSFTVRRISYGEGVERTFPLHSPSIDSIKVIRKGKVKRAKLYYLRKKIGKQTRVESENTIRTAPDASPEEEGAQ